MTNFTESMNIKPTKANDLWHAHGVEVARFTVKSTTQLILVILLIITSLSGNLTICVLMKRFKKMRTVPNMFLANLAIVDILNIVTNMPFLIIVGVFELNHTLHGREASFLIALTQNFFNILKIISMLATMTDRFIAITWGLKYYVWKSKTKAAKAICGVWLVSAVVVLPWAICSAQIDLGDAPTYTYRVVYFDEVGKISTLFVFLGFGLVIAVLSLMTCFSLKRKGKRYERQRKDHSINQIIALVQARTRNEIQAMRTIGLTMAVYFLVYAPCIFYAATMDNKEDMTKSSEVKWFGFVANYFLFVSSACNPFIYLARTKRFRKAIKKLLKTSCRVTEAIQVTPLMQPTATRSVFNKKAVPIHHPKLIRYATFHTDVVSLVLEQSHSSQNITKTTADS